jgi:hypothetical protein
VQATPFRSVRKVGRSATAIAPLRDRAGSRIEAHPVMGVLDNVRGHGEVIAGRRLIQGQKGIAASRHVTLHAAQGSGRSVPVPWHVAREEHFQHPRWRGATTALRLFHQGRSRPRQRIDY